MATSRRTCATMPQPSQLLFRVVRAVGRALLYYMGSTSCKGRGGFGGFCSPLSQWEMSLGRRRWNASDSYTKTWQHFRSANVYRSKARFVGFWWYIRFQDQRPGLWEICTKVTILLPKLRCTQQYVSTRGAMTAAAAADGQLAYSSMNATTHC